MPLVALAQLNRGVEDRAGQRPRLSDLRESGALEMDADVVLLLHRPAQEDAKPVAEIEAIVAKQRNGPTGDLVLAYHKAHLRFESWMPAPGPDPFPN